MCVLVSFEQRILTCFVRGSITVRLTSCFTCLDSTDLLLGQSSQTGQPYIEASEIACHNSQNTFKINKNIGNRFDRPI